MAKFTITTKHTGFGGRYESVKTASDHTAALEIACKELHTKQAYEQHIVGNGKLLFSHITANDAQRENVIATLRKYM